MKIHYFFCEALAATFCSSHPFRVTFPSVLRITPLITVLFRVSSCDLVRRSDQSCPSPLQITIPSTPTSQKVSHYPPSTPAPTISIWILIPLTLRLLFCYAMRLLGTFISIADTVSSKCHMHLMGILGTEKCPFLGLGCCVLGSILHRGCVRFRFGGTFTWGCVLPHSLPKSHYFQARPFLN